MARSVFPIGTAGVSKLSEGDMPFKTSAFLLIPFKRLFEWLDGDVKFTALDPDEPEGPLLLLLASAEECSEESLLVLLLRCLACEVEPPPSVMFARTDPRLCPKLEEILVREKRINLYKDCLKFLKTRVDLDLAQFKDDIWSH